MDTKNHILLKELTVDHFLKNFQNHFFVLDENTIWDSGVRGLDWNLENEEFFIQDGYWYIKKGWSWDGATSAPDGPKDPYKDGYPLIWLATLIHDLGLYHLRTESDFPYKKSQIDNFFFSIMIKRGFKLSGVYFLAVRVYGFTFGNFLWLWGKKNFKSDPIFLEDFDFSSKLFLKTYATEV